MIIDKNQVLDYFQQFIFGSIYNDLDNCIRAKANFAVAALLMSYTEQLGALIEGHLGESGHSYEDFKSFINYFDWNGDSNYYKNFRIKYRQSAGKRENSLDIYEAFRCGLIHEGLPKIPSTIHNNFQDPNYCIPEDKGIGWYHDPQGKILRFHTNAYYRDFKNAIDKVFRQIFVQNDPGITTNCEDSLKRIFNRELIID